MDFTKINQIKKDVESEISDMGVDVEVSEQHFIRINVYMEHNISKMQMIYDKEKELIDKYPDISFDFNIIYK